jgi:hypothetical protein
MVFTPTSVAGSMKAETKKDFKPSALPGTVGRQPEAVVTPTPAKSFTPANALKGERLVIDLPTLADLKKIDPAADDGDLEAVREVLIRNIPAKGIRRNWSDFGMTEQKEAAKLASQFLEMSKKRALVDAQGMMVRVNTLVDQLHEWFEPKGIFNFSNTEAKFQENVRQLESCVSTLKLVSTQLEPVIKELADLGDESFDVEKKIKILLITNHVLSKIRPQDEQDMIDLRLVSLTKSWNNLLEMKMTSSAMVQSMQRINSLLVDTVLTTIPSWISVTTLHYLSDDSNRILAKNKLEEFRSTIKGVI